MMKKLAVKLFVFITSFGFGMLVVNLAIAGVASNPEKGTLWKIEGQGIETSYLLGTFHLISQSDFDLSETAQTLLKQCDNLVLELDMDDPSLQMAMMQHAGMKGEQTLKDLLSEEEYDLVNDQVQSTLGTDLTPFLKMKPFMVSAMLYATLIDESPASYELTLVQLAKANGMEILGLETVEDQMSVFDKIPYEVQADELVEIVTEKEEMSEVFEEMVAYYKDGRIDKLYEMAEEYYEDPEYGKILLDVRNENWIPQVKKMSSDNRVFYAVGAGHLGGQKGFINLLRKAGYTVTPVDQN